MAAGGGKVALVNTTTPLGCNGNANACSVSALATIVDLVGYGNANYYEGSGATPTPSATTSVVRKNNGCTETDNNDSDFEADPAPFTPRNSATTTFSCTVGDTAPSVTGTSPADDAINQAVDVPITVTFSEAVSISGLVLIGGGHRRPA